VNTTCHSRCRRYVDGRAQHTRRILAQLCTHAENPMSSSLPAYRDTTCAEPRIEACITCTCTNFGLQNTGRKSNVCAHNDWGVPIDVLTSMNNAPWCVVRKSLLSPPIELHGHRGSAWRVIKCVPLVTDFMGRVYISPINFVKLWALLLLSVAVDTLDWNRYLELLSGASLGLLWCYTIFTCGWVAKAIDSLCWVV
jgi:hypothetical protein